jgi:hypothetical protein
MLREARDDTSKPSSPNPYVFLVGCSRSGTTLLQRVVDAHPQVAVTHEQDWIANYFRKRAGLTPDGRVTPELIARLLQHKRFPKLGVGREDLQRLLGPGPAVGYAAFVTGILDLHGKARGKRLVGDKCPSYVLDIPSLHTLWPGARFVHLIRDGRDVCLSLLNWDRPDRITARFVGCAEDRVLTSALYWKWLVQAGREAGRWLGPERYYEIRYEALLADAPGECARLCAFLGVPYTAAMLRFHERRRRNEPGLDAKAAWLPITRGLRDWRAQMPPAQLERFEAAAGDLLGELGYPRACPRPRPEIQHALAAIKEACTGISVLWGTGSPERGKSAPGERREPLANWGRGPS